MRFARDWPCGGKTQYRHVPIPRKTVSSLAAAQSPLSFKKRLHDRIGLPNYVTASTEGIALQRVFSRPAVCFAVLGVVFSAACSEDPAAPRASNATSAIGVPAAGGLSQHTPTAGVPSARGSVSSSPSIFSPPAVSSLSPPASATAWSAQPAPLPHPA